MRLSGGRDRADSFSRFFLPKLYLAAMNARKSLLTLALLMAGHALAYCENPLLPQSSVYKYSDLVIGENAWVFLNQASPNDFRTDYSISPNSLQALKTLSDMLKAEGTQLVMVLPPTKALMEVNHLPSNHPILKTFNVSTGVKSYQSTIAALNAAGILAPDIHAYMAKNRGDMYLKQDPHWSPAGAESAAEAVADLIKAQPAFKEIEQADVKVMRSEPRAFISSTVNAIQAICGTSTPEQFPMVTSESGDLFSNPEVSVVGTSFSANSMFPFAVHLAERLGVSVGNAAISAGGYHNAILQYLEYVRKEAPVKFLVWEFASWYGYNNINLYRQVIPAAKGKCATSEGSVGSSLPLKARSGQYLYLSFSDETNEVTLQIRAKGQIEEIKLSRLPGLAAKEYFWQLDPASESVTVTTPNGKPFQYGICSL